MNVVCKCATLYVCNDINKTQLQIRFQAVPLETVLIIMTPSWQM